MQKYTLYDGDRCVLAPVLESALRSYISSYGGNLERLTVYADTDKMLDDGMSVPEWLADNAPAPQKDPVNLFRVWLQGEIEQTNSSERWAFEKALKEFNELF